MEWFPSRPRPPVLVLVLEMYRKFEDEDEKDVGPDANFRLRPWGQLNIFTLLAMENHFQLKPPSQTLQPSRFGPAAWCASLPLKLAARAANPGFTHRK